MTEVNHNMSGLQTVRTANGVRITGVNQRGEQYVFEFSVDNIRVLAQIAGLL